MCGILGIIEGDRAHPADQSTARGMAAALLHRGPDDEGFHFEGHVALGMRRLSIIDLPGGHQPIANEDETIWIVFNGEIYNYRELRAELQARGHRFRTRSDTEVIVHLYEEQGDRLVEHLNGMFAFALWDRRRERLLLARDRMGEKPLYYTHLADGTFLFASELKSLLTHPRLDRQLDLCALRKYLAYEFIPSPHSIIKNVKKLPPAHRLVFERGAARIDRYWQLSYDEAKTEHSEAEAIEELRARLREAVRRRLVADVSLGVLLSGGVDSSAIAALACEAGADRVKTFSIAFAEPSFDESSFARRVAAHLGTEHHEQIFTEREMLEVVPQIPQLLDEPFGDASLIPTFMLARFTRSEVTVALGGDGGDELFAGYQTYLAHQLAGYYRALPGFVRARLIEPAVERLPVSTANLSFDFRAKRFVRGAALPAGTRHAVWMGSFDAALQRQLLTADAARACPDEEAFAEMRDFDVENGTDLVERMMKLDATYYLSEDVLFKVDRASMAASLEVRAPYLDHTFIEFVARLPRDYKLRGLTSKYILKRAFRDRLPRAVTDRPKKGFGMPVAKWIKGELGDLVRETFDPSRLDNEGLFRPATVARLLDEHITGRADHRKLIWTLLMFEMWPGRRGS
jgi:asparagine synthase (glutamine-hydrolysing)